MKGADMEKVSNEKPAVVGGSLSETTWQGEHSDVQRDNQFCIADEQNASGNDLLKVAEARRQVAGTLAALTLQERRAVLSNFYPLDDGDRLEGERQKLAAAMRGRFGIAGWIDDICAMWGWRFTGFNWVDLTGIWEDDLERDPDLEWMRPGDDDHAVRLVVGDHPLLLLSDDGGNTWREISIDQLGDALGDWCEGRDMVVAAA